MTDKTAIAKSVRDYIEEFVLYGDELESDGVSLIASGMIDSTGAMELVFFLEETFGIEVPVDDINPGNLDTVELATNLVYRLLGGEAEQTAIAQG